MQTPKTQTHKAKGYAKWQSKIKGVTVDNHQQNNAYLQASH
jgi:hypothetical protein